MESLKTICVLFIFFALVSCSGGFKTSSTTKNGGSTGGISATSSRDINNNGNPTRGRFEGDTSGGNGSTTSGDEETTTTSGDEETTATSGEEEEEEGNNNQSTDGGNDGNNETPGETAGESAGGESAGGESAGEEGGGGGGNPNCECEGEYLDSAVYNKECSEILCAVEKKATQCTALGSAEGAENIATTLNGCGVFSAIGSSCAKGDSGTLYNSIKAGSVNSDASGLPKQMNDYMCQQVKNTCETCEECDEEESSSSECKNECTECMIGEVFAECEKGSCAE